MTQSTQEVFILPSCSFSNPNCPIRQIQQAVEDGDPNEIAEQMRLAGMDPDTVNKVRSGELAIKISEDGLEGLHGLFMTWPGITLGTSLSVVVTPDGIKVHEHGSKLASFDTELHEDVLTKYRQYISLETAVREMKSKQRQLQKDTRALGHEVDALREECELTFWEVNGKRFYGEPSVNLTTKLVGEHTNLLRGDKIIAKMIDTKVYFDLTNIIDQIKAKADQINSNRDDMTMLTEQLRVESLRRGILLSQFNRILGQHHPALKTEMDDGVVVMSQDDDLQPIFNRIEIVDKESEGSLDEYIELLTSLGKITGVDLSELLPKGIDHLQKMVDAIEQPNGETTEPVNQDVSDTDTEPSNGHEVTTPAESAETVGA